MIKIEISMLTGQLIMTVNACENCWLKTKAEPTLEDVGQMCEAEGQEEDLRHDSWM